MALLKVIEWADNSSNTLVYKVDTRKNVIKRGSALTVREGQVAVFCDKGRMADVFQPGYYKLDTDSFGVRQIPSCSAIPISEQCESAVTELILSASRTLTYL